MFRLFEINIKLVLILILIVLTSILISSLAFAEVSQTDISTGDSDKVSTLLEKNHTIINGGTSYDNLSLLSSTKRWAAFYGNVSGSLVLGDSSNDMVYSWSISNFTDSVIYATTTSISDWSNTNIEAADSSDQEKFLLKKSNDNYTNVFNESETFTSSSLSETNTLFSRTMQNSVSGNFKTYSLHAITEDTPLWAVKVREDDSSFIVGQTVDYQLLVPVKKSETYKFYLELY